LKNYDQLWNHGHHNAFYSDGSYRGYEYEWGKNMTNLPQTCSYPAHSYHNQNDYSGNIHSHVHRTAHTDTHQHYYGYNYPLMNYSKSSETWPTVGEKQTSHHFFHTGGLSKILCQMLHMPVMVHLFQGLKNPIIAIITRISMVMSSGNFKTTAFWQ